VTAVDNPSSKAISTMTTQGATDGGQRTFTGTPSPASVIIQHSSAPGEKSVEISCQSTITCYPSSAAAQPATITGGGSVTVATGKRNGTASIDNGSAHEYYEAHIDGGTSYGLYVPYVDNGTGWDIQT
jgi:hypothetical protein